MGFSGIFAELQGFHKEVFILPESNPGSSPQTFQKNRKMKWRLLTVELTFNRKRRKRK